MRGRGRAGADARADAHAAAAAIPTLNFVNKTDRRGADPERVAREVAEKLRLAATPIGSVELTELLADHADDAFLAAYLDGAAPVHSELVAQTRRALVHPALRRLGDRARASGS